jgi:TatA/E family protein of Tat protein translocase
MFGIGMPELLVIFVIALLVFGPKELPKIGRTIGKAMGEFRRASDELRDGIQREIELAERDEKPPAPTAGESVFTPESEATSPIPEFTPGEPEAEGPAPVGGAEVPDATVEPGGPPREPAETQAQPETAPSTTAQPVEPRHA